ncbi:MAG: hypothetical protein WD875_02295 [Pirellulales bacterium]
MHDATRAAGSFRWLARDEIRHEARGPLLWPADIERLDDAALVA